VAGSVGLRNLRVGATVLGHWAPNRHWRGEPLAGLKGQRSEPKQVAFALDDVGGAGAVQGFAGPSARGETREANELVAQLSTASIDYDHMLMMLWPKAVGPAADRLVSIGRKSTPYLLEALADPARSFRRTSCSAEFGTRVACSAVRSSCIRVTNSSVSDITSKVCGGPSVVVMALSLSTASRCWKPFTHGVVTCRVGSAQKFVNPPV